MNCFLPFWPRHELSLKLIFTAALTAQGVYSCLSYNTEDSVLECLSYYAPHEHFITSTGLLPSPSFFFNEKRRNQSHAWWLLNPKYLFIKCLCIGSRQERSSLSPFLHLDPNENISQVNHRLWQVVKHFIVGLLFYIRWFLIINHTAN